MGDYPDGPVPSLPDEHAGGPNARRHRDLSFCPCVCDKGESLGHPSVLALYPLHPDYAIVKSLLEATLDRFSSIVEGLNCSCSPEGPKRDSSVSVTNPLD